MPERNSLIRVRRFLASQLWAMRAEALDAMLAVVELRASGVRLTSEEIEGRLSAARHEGQATAPSTIALLPLYGIISQRVGMLTEFSGGTSTDAFGAAYRRAMADSEIGAVVIDADGPGGSVFGVQETAALIRSTRGQKPVVAVVNSQAASATLWIAAQAEEMVITPSGEAGSVGVLAIHEDHSVEAEQAGVKLTIMTSSGAPYKAEGNPYEPLSDDATQRLKSRLDAYESVFFKDMAKARGVSVSKVRADFGQGRMLLAGEAVGAGLADRIATLQETVDRLAAGMAKGRGRGGARAEVNGATIMAEAIATAPADIQAAVAESCATCDHPRADHPDDGPCTADGCDCEGYVPAGGAKAEVPGDDGARARAELALAEIGG